MPCFIIFIGGVIQVVIPVERGPVIVPVVGKKFFLTAIQGIEPGKDNVFRQGIFFDVFTEVTLPHPFKTKFFFIQAIFEMGVSGVKLIPYF